jgi:hypothetical protein
MIQINDNDQPIEVAQKIVTGTMRGVIINDDSLSLPDNLKECEVGMFSLEEIKEIIDYLTVYYEAHKEGEAE